MNTKKLAINTALFLMMLELTYINAKSLLFIVDDFAYVDKVFAIIGSLAFSMVTIIVMRTSQQKWTKIVFPVFDSALVFCGFNLKFASELTQNPIALGLTIFMALFTGLIMYSLGTIKLKTETAQNQTEINTLKTHIEELLCEIMDSKSESISLKTDIEKYKTQINSIKSEFNSKETELIKYKAVYLQAEKSRILKKNEKNRTPEEIEILEQANQ